MDQNQNVETSHWTSSDSWAMKLEETKEIWERSRREKIGRKEKNREGKDWERNSLTEEKGNTVYSNSTIC